MSPLSQSATLFSINLPVCTTGDGPSSVVAATAHQIWDAITSVAVRAAGGDTPVAVLESSAATVADEDIALELVFFDSAPDPSSADSVLSVSCATLSGAYSDIPPTLS